MGTDPIFPISAAAHAPGAKLEAFIARSIAMSDKQKRPLPKDAPDTSKGMEAKLHQSDKFRRGIESEEMHRQGGNRVRDQGQHKR